ncbi:MAG: carboxymuconolactone decarboxylase family protein [Alphaproteobacteria bacterium]
MARVTPIRREDAPDLEDVFSRAEQALGFVPNSFFAMGRSPGILRAFTRLAREVIGVPGKVPLPLKRMAGYMASRSAGCMYCSSHTAETASVVDGVPPEKVAAIWEYETSDLFDDAERAVLRMAQGAGTTPNAVSDEDMEELHKYFDYDQIVELVAAVCLFGWLNRWNDTLATDLEPRPLEFGLSTLSDSGWKPGKHVSGD